GGALLGGFTLNYFAPRNLYLIMAGGDLLQVLVCIFLIYRLGIAWAQEQTLSNNEKENKSSVKAKRFAGVLPSYLVKLSLVSLLFYFAAFSLRPFLSLYWQQISKFNSEIVSGLVYSIPGWVALVGLWLNFRFNSRLNLHQRILVAFSWTLLASVIQSSGSDWMLVLGRIIYGWGLFQGMVCLEVLLFKVSEPKHYARDFSRIHWFQNFGVILASFTSGYLVAEQNLRWPFFAAAVLFAITLVTFLLSYKQQIFNRKPETLMGEKQVVSG
ncbi:MAG: MFS transporter, partial [Kangiellaceae bacterium]|nr:MFS transporter [Kangiellaceae bacterium]